MKKRRSENIPAALKGPNRTAQGKALGLGSAVATSDVASAVPRYGSDCCAIVSKPESQMSSCFVASQDPPSRVTSIAAEPSEDADRFFPSLISARSARACSMSVVRWNVGACTTAL